MTDYKIKPDMLEEYKKYAGNNSTDPYSFGVMIAGCASFEVLDNPEKTCQEAEQAWKGMGLSGNMAGCAAQMIVRYHERGIEFNDFWNAQYNVPKGTKGTVNPAIVTITTK